MRTTPLVEARCVEVNCPHFGWVKVKFDILDFDYWEDCRDKGMNITFTCICGETHEIQGYF